MESGNLISGLINFMNIGYLLFFRVLYLVVGEFAVLILVFHKSKTLLVLCVSITHLLIKIHTRCFHRRLLCYAISITSEPYKFVHSHIKSLISEALININARN